MNDTVCTLVPYFAIHAGQEDAFRAGIAAFYERTRTEDGCVHYAFSFSGSTAHCREGYVDAAAVLAHLENVGDLLEKALEIADLARLEVHAPASEIEQLREPLADLGPEFFELDPNGFRN